MSIQHHINGFHYYLGALGCSAIAMGLQVVIFPWLVVGVLNEAPDRVGLAQMAVMLPNLLLILWGGALSDNRHLGTFVSRLYLLYMLPFAVMLVATLAGYLSYSLLILFGTTYGVISAFVQPARESLLSQLAADNLQRSVALSTLVQFAGQSLGLLAAGLFERVGLASLLILQMLLFIATSVLIRTSQPPGFGLPAGRQTSGGRISSGLREVWHHPRLLPLMSVVGATGFLGFGAYLVAIPIMAREIYQQGSFFFAALQLSFAIGVLLSNIAYMRLTGGFRRPGKVLIISLFLRGLVMLFIATRLPEMLLFPMVVLWGMLSGISISLGRVMTHAEAPESHRSRVVSIYQLALFGSAPIGAWLCGQMIGWWGVLEVFAVLGVCTVGVACAGVFSQLWRSRPERPASQQ